MAQEEDAHSLEAKFVAAVKVIRSLPEEGDAALCSFQSDWTCVQLVTVKSVPVCV